MKYAPLQFLLLGLLILSAESLHARSPRIKIDRGPRDLDARLQYVPSQAARGNAPSGLPPTTLAFYDFETLDPMGWTSHDRASIIPFLFFIADNSLLSGGSFGRLLPLTGSKSVWCGVPFVPLDPNFCSYASTPGYGNDWNQAFESVAITKPAGSSIRFEYQIAYDTETLYDHVYLEYLNNLGEWTAATLPSTGTTSYTGLQWPYVYESVTIPAASLPSTSVRLRFRFQSDSAWSDEDGLWNTDGAVLIDELRVMTGIGAVLNLQTFEAESGGQGNTNDGTWAGRGLGRGDFAQLYAGGSTLQRSPPLAAGDVNNSSVWGFYNGSSETYACGGFGTYAAVPHSDGNGNYLNNAIRSPWIPWEPMPGQTTHLRFQVYRDLPLDNLVVYEWRVRTRSDGGCPTAWRNDNYIYWGNTIDWYTFEKDLSTYIATTAGADEIQIEVGVMDMANVYVAHGIGSGACHSNAPLIDNVEVYLDNTHSWLVDDLDLFQDAFPGDGTLTGTIRADAASGEDVVTFRVAEPGVGIAAEGNGPAVFCHVKTLPGKSGAVVSGGTQWPYVPSLSDNDWTVVQCTFGGDANEYTLDLNDELYEAGDVVYFYFSARSKNATTSYYSQFTGMTTDENEVRAQPMEFTGLPSGASTVLYVDYFSGYGAEPFFNTSFLELGVTPDRYDVRSPSSLAGNGPGSKLGSEDQLYVYDTLIFNAGWFSDPVVSNDDWLLLAVFAEYNTNSPVGIYMSGDNLASLLESSDFFAASYFKSTYCDFSIVSDSHRDVGLPVSPMVLPAGGSPVTGALVAYGGAASPPGRFDVLQPGQNAVSAMNYEGDPGRAALILQSSESPVTQSIVNVALSGFSHHKIRDDGPSGIQDRTQLLHELLDALTGNGGIPVTVDRPAPGVKNALEQNAPNPFNPVTTIRYSIAQAGRVSFVIYDAAGGRVATLVNEVQQPVGAGHSVTWDGRTNTGTQAASGVYFYKLTAPGFTQTRKMVLLK